MQEFVVVKRKPGRPIKRHDPIGVKDRARKAANQALPQAERNPVGRQRSTDRKYVRRRERQDEDDVVDQVGACRMDDPEAPGKFSAALACKRGQQKLGQLGMGKRLKTEQEIAEMAQVHANSARYHRQATGTEKKKYRLSAMQGVQDSTAASVLGVTERTIRRYAVSQMTCKSWKELFKSETVMDEETDMDEGLTDEDYGAGDVKRLINDMYIEFFCDNTGVQSGSVRATRMLAIAKHALFVRLFAVFPKLLRQFYDTYPEVLDTMPKLCRLRVMMEAALNNAQQPGFNEQEERRTRTKMVMARYKRKLAAKRNRSYRSIAPARLKKNEEDEEKVDPEVYAREIKIRPIGDKEFLQLVKDRGIRWTKKNKPYNCPIHLNGPLLEPKKTKCVAAIDVIDEALAALARIKGLNSQQRKERTRLMTSRRAQKKKLRKLDQEIDKYDEHLKQYEVCRKALDDLAVNLKPGQCIIYRDFVNQYTSDGKKMGNLQLVLLYRLIPGTNLLQLKVYNFSGG
jgi:hypothetical protein